MFLQSGESSTSTLISLYRTLTCCLMLLAGTFGIAQEEVISVGTYDLRNEDPTKHQTITAANSRHSLAMLYFGSDGAVFQILMDAANQAISEGIPVKGVFAGVSSEPRSNDLEFFANVHWAGALSTADVSTLRNRVISRLRSNNEKFLVSEVLRESPVDGEPLEVFEARRMVIEMGLSKERIRVLERQQEAMKNHLENLQGQN